MEQNRLLGLQCFSRTIQPNYFTFDCSSLAVTDKLDRWICSILASCVVAQWVRIGINRVTLMCWWKVFCFATALVLTFEGQVIQSGCSQMVMSARKWLDSGFSQWVIEYVVLP